MRGRHNRIADDSCIVSLIIPKSLKRDIDDVAEDTKRTRSDVMRKAMFAGVRMIHKTKITGTAK